MYEYLIIFLEKIKNMPLKNILDILTSIGSLLTAYFAFKALSQWRNGYLGKEQLKIASELLTNLGKIKEANKTFYDTVKNINSDFRGMLGPAISNEIDTIENVYRELTKNKEHIIDIYLGSRVREYYKTIVHHMSFISYSISNGLPFLTKESPKITFDKETVLKTSEQVNNLIQATLPTLQKYMKCIKKHNPIYCPHSNCDVYYTDTNSLDFRKINTTQHIIRSLQIEKSVIKSVYENNGISVSKDSLDNKHYISDGIYETKDGVKRFIEIKYLASGKIFLTDIYTKLNIIKKYGITNNIKTGLDYIIVEKKQNEFDKKAYEKFQEEISSGTLKLIFITEKDLSQ